jgi:hypothetical protein
MFPHAARLRVPMGAALVPFDLSVRSQVTPVSNGWIVTSASFAPGQRAGAELTKE